MVSPVQPPKQDPSLASLARGLVKVLQEINHLQQQVNALSNDLEVVKQILVEHTGFDTDAKTMEVPDVTGINFGEGTIEPAQE